MSELINGELAIYDNNVMKHDQEQKLQRRLFEQYLY